ncbi:MAG: MATE family efflux transporter [Flammeovirgaceae bacterium]|nr:MATE family efflux transporter [Flammeovirgaceae bacterium]MBR10279.1 MATE family efflux transporter [Rickettsiales bacterium]HCX22918.1 MATE family efflux transporter [Cytophagales bacterium]|tara:strand:+ start:2897 stop:4330 length:1434 start_codon:yes stop_codon:yes gene_type:complete
MTNFISFFKRFVHLFIMAIKGTEKEFTSGSINRAIFLLSIPMIGEMIMESLFAVFDVLFVSRISINAVATVGLTESVLMIIYSVAVGLSMATTAIVARRVGEKNYKRAGDAAFQSIFLAIIVGLSLGVLGLIYAEDVLLLMGGESKLIQEGVGFTRIMFGGNLVIFLLFLNNAIFRGAGDASIAMRSLIIANSLNIVLDPLLIFGWGPVPAFGIEGAAIATTIGRSVGVLYQTYHLLNRKGIIKIGWSNVVIRVKTVFELIKVSIGGMGQFLIETAAWIFLVRVMALFGSEALAGYTIAFRIIVFTILPSWGLSNAAATLVGQNLGAGHPDRAEKSVWKAAFYNMLFLGIVAIIFFVAAEPIIWIFNQSPSMEDFGESSTVKEIGVSALKIICCGYIFFAYGMVISQAFNGAGDTRTPLIVNFFVFWVIQIPMAYYLAVVLDWQATGVFFTIAFAHSLQAIVSIYLFRRGKWKTMTV